VQSKRQDFGRSASGRRNGDVSRGVIEKARLQLRDVGDPFSIGRPAWSSVRSGVRGHLGEVSALVRIVRRDYPDVDVIGRIGVRLRAIAADSNELAVRRPGRSEEHTSELQSLAYLVCRLLLEKKKQNYSITYMIR